MLDAPNLRELLIDVRLVSKLAKASTSELSFLSLRLMTAAQHGGEQEGMERIKDHQGDLELIVGEAHTHHVLPPLSTSFLWPGLSRVELGIVRDV